MSEPKCEVCGHELMKLQNGSHICGCCKAYHDPEPCVGNGCKICEDIRWMRKGICKEVL